MLTELLNLELPAYQLVFVEVNKLIVSTIYEICGEWNSFVWSPQFGRIHCWWKSIENWNLRKGHLWYPFILFIVRHFQEWTWLNFLVSLLEVHKGNIFYLKLNVSNLCLSFYHVYHRWLINEGTEISDLKKKKNLGYLCMDRMHILDF